MRAGQPFVPKQRHVFVGVDDGLKVGKRAHGHAHKLNVQRAVFRGGQGGLFDRFCEGGVGVAHAGDVFRTGPEFHGDHRLGNHVRGTWATHVHAQISSVSAWANTFTMPSVSMLARARPLL